MPIAAGHGVERPDAWFLGRWAPPSDQAVQLRDASLDQAEQVRRGQGAQFPI